jgi:hypothetical protein
VTRDVLWLKRIIQVGEDTIDLYKHDKRPDSGGTAEVRQYLIAKKAIVPNILQ